jgi:hypothetical protein
VDFLYSLCSTALTDPRSSVIVMLFRNSVWPPSWGIGPFRRLHDRGSSVSIIMSDYRLDDRATGVQFPAVSTSDLRTTQPPIQRVSGVLLTGVKRGRVVTLTNHPIQCWVQEWVGALFFSPCRLHGGSGIALIYFTLSCIDNTILAFVWRDWGKQRKTQSG